MTQSGGPIRLAGELPFRLGALEFEPATRQMRHGGETRTLEPRVMQVLVLLASANGRVVGRDELIERCWDGRVVGEQAINRVMAIIRKLASEAGQAFAIETVTKVGYRLTPVAHEQSAAGAPRPGLAPTSEEPAARRFDRRAVFVAAGVGAAGIAGGLWTLRRRPNQVSPVPVALIDKGFDELDQELPGYDQQAIAFFRKATELSPDKPEGWGALALGYALTATFDTEASARATISWTRSAAQRALELDSGNADARVALALAKPSFRRWGPYEAECRALLAVHRSHPFLLGALGQCMCDVGRWGEAVGLYERWAALQPNRLSPQFALALAYWGAHRLTQAEAAFDRLARLWPSHARALSARLNFLVLNGRTAEAEEAAQQFQGQVRAPPLLPLPLAMAAARAIAADDSGAKQALVGQFKAAREERRIAPAPALAYLSALGAVEDAFGVLRSYLFGGSAPWAAGFRPIWPLDRPTDLLFGDAMRAIRAHAHFPAVTQALGLDAYWRATGIGPDYRAPSNATITRS